MLKIKTNKDETVNSNAKTIINYLSLNERKYTQNILN